MLVAPLGRLVIVKIPIDNANHPPGGKRQDVLGFSRESRKRLMQLVASLDTTTLVGKTQFVTLTYHRTWGAYSPAWHDDLRKFLQRLERQYGQHAVIWRLEYQKRGAPHFHLLVLDETSIDPAWCVHAWGEIAHSDSEYHGEYGIDVQRLDSVEKAMVYLAKYVAKPADGTIPARGGRMWGVRRKELLPVTIVEADLDVTSAYRLKAALIDTMDQDTVNPWLRKGRGGVWTMIDGADALRMAGELCGTGVRFVRSDTVTLYPSDLTD